MDYKKVIEDFNNGTLNPKEVQLVMDNDCGYWSCLLDDEDKHEEICETLEKKYGEPQGYRDIVDVLIGAGVNAGWC